MQVFIKVKISVSLWLSLAHSEWTKVGIWAKRVWDALLFLPLLMSLEGMTIMFCSHAQDWQISSQERLFFQSVWQKLFNFFLLFFFSPFFVFCYAVLFLGQSSLNKLQNVLSLSCFTSVINCIRSVLTRWAFFSGSWRCFVVGERPHLRVLPGIVVVCRGPGSSHISPVHCLDVFPTSWTTWLWPLGFTHGFWACLWPSFVPTDLFPLTWQPVLSGKSWSHCTQAVVLFTNICLMLHRYPAVKDVCSHCLGNP